MPHISTYGGTYLKDELTGVRRSIVHEDRDAKGGDLDVNDMAITSNLGSTSGPTEIKSEAGGASYMTGIIEAPAEMTSLGESPDRVLEIGTTSGPGGSSYMTGVGFPTDNVSGTSGPGGTSF